MAKARKIIPPMIPSDDEESAQVDSTVVGRTEYFAAEPTAVFLAETQSEFAAESQAVFVAEKD